MAPTPHPKLGVSGRIARYFQSAQITPLIALIALLLGIFAVLVTPREEEPQINVTMANVLIPFPGASAKDVEQMVAAPAEQVISRIVDVEHVTSVSQPGLAVITVQFEVGVPRITALVSLYDTILSNQDWLPRNLGTLQPIIKPKGIDDVPIVSLALYAKDPVVGTADLERVARAIETDLKRVPGSREIETIGGPRRAINVRLDPARMNAAGVTVTEIRNALLSANNGAPIGEITVDNRAVLLDAGPFFRDARDVGGLMVATRNGVPVFLEQVAVIDDGPPIPEQYVWYGTSGKDAREYPAIVIGVTKKPGQNAVQVADALVARVDNLRNTVIPPNVVVEVTRNYGATANDKAIKLIQKLALATLSVIVLVWVALGRREAVIVGTAVVLTLFSMLFASWAWGFTLNRVSLFALIFSIGIIVDDAIVVVENIHRHRQLEPARPLTEIIPEAVDEVGGPTILATLTVIAALLPMAFVTGLMGPYMSPIPINASMGMLISLAIAFVITPWLALILLPAASVAHAAAGGRSWLSSTFARTFAPFLGAAKGGRNRLLLWLGIAVLIAVSLALPVLNLVVMKMLPFDNKSEFQVVVDMPAGTSLERTAAVLREMGAYLATVPEVANYQAFAGTSAPINFNGLVRQYYLRRGGDVGDLQVNLVDHAHRHDQSHAIATRLRPELVRIADAFGARVKVVEVPPGPPVLAPIVAEIYGPDDAGRIAVARQVEAQFRKQAGVVDADASPIADAPRWVVAVDRSKAALAGVRQDDVVATLRAGLAGEDVTYLRDASKYPAAIRLQLPAEAQGDLDALLQLTVRGAAGRPVPLREIVTVDRSGLREQPRHHKDLLPVEYVVGDTAGSIDSPLYGMFAMRPSILELEVPGGGTLAEYFISQPDDPYRGYSIKWNGEWQVTYETFRDMGLAYAVGLILIYLLVVAEFGSYLTPLIIMAPIPLTIIGVMPGHALLGAQFTATSMIGMIALAGIIVRNSILLVDFIKLQIRDGVRFEEAIVRSAEIRAQPIALTALAAMLGALFILDDPIFNGLAVSLIFGILVSTLLTLVVIPLLYYTAYRRKFTAPLENAS
ncbi:MAG: efflux RND transporter permease subunit [Burkholderiales bacterium]|nr:efflux RND transporter permease subunit [Burkholderiales bacterium]